MDGLIQPILLYALIGLGAIGLYLALPKRGTNPQVLGALLAALAVGGIILALSLSAKKAGALPSPFFYVFGLMALGSALRVITHPRPVYAALWFIMVVLSTAGLMLLLSAEFMTAAIIIVYAGAILITYLFVIMLATQAPEESRTESLAEYDVGAHEPIAATLVGFVLLALLTGVMFRGIPGVPRATSPRDEGLLAAMPRKIESALRDAKAIAPGERVALDEFTRAAALDARSTSVAVVDSSGARRQVALPPDLRVTNVERVGFNLLRDHPGTIEIAGVILTMAMLGAVVLSRKQVQLDEDAKRRHARRLGGEAGA